MSQRAQVLPIIKTVSDDFPYEYRGTPYTLRASVVVDELLLRPWYGSVDESISEWADEDRAFLQVQLDDLRVGDLEGAFGSRAVSIWDQRSLRVELPDGTLISPVSGSLFNTFDVPASIEEATLLVGMNLELKLATWERSTNYSATSFASSARVRVPFEFKP